MEPGVFLIWDTGGEGDVLGMKIIRKIKQDFTSTSELITCSNDGASIVQTVLSNVTRALLHFGHSFSGDKVCGISPGIVGHRISNVVEKVLNGALAGDNCLDKESKHGEHCQSSVLDLFHLQFCECVRVISQSKWVEGTSRVDLVKAFAKRTTTNSVSFNETHEHNLASPYCKNALGVDKVGVAKIVKSTLREDLSTSLEPDSLTEFDTILCKDFREDTAKCTKHCPAAVDHLKLTVLGKCLGVRRQSSSIPAIVTGEFTGQCLPNALWDALDGSAHGDAASEAANLADKIILLLQCCLTRKCRPLNCRGSHGKSKA
ncbi:hypothetical protein RJ641_017164 [Dillenia turbinata]|uniref:Uncharacterized protein n=1 Tax=Dillenia turbinata TaxID=194707 RepID=A0AAN8UXL6_9MAGN